MALVRVLVAAIGASVLASGCTPKYSAEYQAAIERAEAQHVQSLKAAAAGGLLDETRHTASIFLSARIVNGLLDGAEQLQVQIPKFPGAVLTVDKVEAKFRDGFPLFEGDATLSGGGLPAPIKAHVALELVHEIRNGSLLVLSPRLLAIDPSVKVGATDHRLKGILNELLANKIRQNLPIIEVPISNSAAINQAPKVQTVTLPTGSGSVTGVVKAPGITAASDYRVSQVVFLSDGLHIFVDGGIRAATGR